MICENCGASINPPQVAKRIYAEGAPADHEAYVHEELSICVWYLRNRVDRLETSTALRLQRLRDKLETK